MRTNADNLAKIYPKYYFNKYSIIFQAYFNGYALSQKDGSQEPSLKLQNRYERVTKRPSDRCCFKRFALQRAMVNFFRARGKHLAGKLLVRVSARLRRHAIAGLRIPYNFI